MAEHESKRALYFFINVRKNPKMYQFDSSSWIMVEFMYAQVTEAILAIIFFVNYVALPCDEVNIVDNGSWISIHAYVVQNWVRVPMLLSLQKVVDGIGIDNLTIVIIKALQKGGGLNLAFVF
jgi:hypothetical protein